MSENQATEPVELAEQPQPEIEAPDPALRTFTDTEGRPWRLQLNIGNVKAIKADLNIDLLGVDGDFLKGLGANPMDFCNLLWALVSKQAAAASVDETAFWESIDDTALDAATYAFFEALIAFFRADKRGPLRLVLTKMKAAEQRQIQHAAKLAEGPEMDAFIRRQMETRTANATAALANGEV